MNDARSTEPWRDEGRAASIPHREDTSGYVVEWQLLHGGNEGDEAPQEPTDDLLDLWRDSGLLPGVSS